jgi:TonB family protein
MKGTAGMLRPHNTICSPQTLARFALLIFPLLCFLIVFGQEAPDTREREEAIKLYRQHQYSAASDKLKKLVAQNKNDDRAWTYLGLALLNQPKRIKDAAKAFETALKLKPTAAVAHAGLAYSFLNRNKSLDAVREAEAALSSDPNLSDAHYIIGVVRLRTGAMAEALREAEAAVKLDRNFGAAYLLESQALIGSFGENAPPVSGPEGREATRSRYARAATALENYLRLNSQAEEKQTWLEQLETLRFYGAPHTSADPEEIVTSKLATTKAHVLRKPEPQYTNDARAAGVIGTVVLRAVFAADGTVQHILVVKSLPYGLTENAIKAARQIKFTPASVEGRAVSMFIQLEYNFYLY